LSQSLSQDFVRFYDAATDFVHYVNIFQALGATYRRQIVVFVDLNGCETFDYFSDVFVEQGITKLGVFEAQTALVQHRFGHFKPPQ
jgi:hypothetical protein